MLVVDEDAEVRHQVERIVDGYGGIATTTPCPQRAVAFSSRVRPSVVISDLHLGNGEGGVWLLDELRSGALAKVPVIAMGPAKTDQDLAEVLPFSAFIAKPVDAQELCALILGVVDRRAS